MPTGIDIGSLKVFLGIDNDEVKRKIKEAGDEFDKYVKASKDASKSASLQAKQQAAAFMRIREETKKAEEAQAKYNRAIVANELKMGAKALKDIGIEQARVERAAKAAEVAQKKYNVSIVSNELSRGAKALKQIQVEQAQAEKAAKAAEAAQRRYNRSVVANELRRGAQALREIRRETEKNARKTNRLLDSMAVTFNGFVKTVRAATIGYFTVLGTMKFIDFSTGVIKAGAELDSLNRTFKAITGSTAQAQYEMEFIGSTANRLGLDVRVLEDSYRGFLAATKETAIEGAETRRIFTAIVKTAAVLGMSVDDTRGTMRSFIQMLSKGTVQAEELRGQLGERLFGAFQLAAKSMKTNTQGLNEWLKQGKVLALDLLPKLSDTLENRYGAAAEEAGLRAEASFIRFRNSILYLQRGMATSGVLDSFADLADSTREWIEANEDLLAQDLGAVFRIVGFFGKVALGTISGFVDKYEQLRDIAFSIGADKVFIELFSIDVEKGPVELLEEQEKKVEGLRKKLSRYQSQQVLFENSRSRMRKRIIERNIKATTEELKVNERALKMLELHNFAIEDRARKERELIDIKEKSAKPFVFDKEETPEEREKKLKAISKAYQQAYGVIENVTDRTYDEMIKIYEEEKKAYEELTGDKITFHEMFIQRVKELDEKRDAAANERIRKALERIKKEVTQREKEEKAAEKQAQRVKDSIDSQNKSLSTQVAVFGKSEKEATLYRLSLQGATKDQLDLAEAILNAIEKQEGLIEIEKKRKELMQEGVQVTLEMRNATEVFADEMERLDKLYKANAINEETYGRARTKAAEEGFTKPPGMDTTDDSVFTELDRLNEEQEKLNEWYDEQLSLLEGYRQARSDMESFWNEKEEELTKQHTERLNKIERARTQYMLTTASNMFGDLANIAAAFGDDQSDVYRALFATSKAFSVAEATLNMFQAISEAGASGPFPWNLGAMATVAAKMSALIASISSVGMAHEGIESVPKTGTWLLEKGERVTTEQTSKKLDRTLSSIQAQMSERNKYTQLSDTILKGTKVGYMYNKTMATPSLPQRASSLSFNEENSLNNAAPRRREEYLNQKSIKNDVHIANLIDSKVIKNYLSSSDGRKAIKNVIASDRFFLRSLGRR